MTRYMYWLSIISLLVSLSRTTLGFLASRHFLSHSSSSASSWASTSALGLIPLTQFRHELKFFSPAFFDDEQRCCIDQDGTFNPNNGEDPFEICLVEESDLPEVSLFIVKAFGADAISLSSTEFNSFEKAIMAPAMDFFNGYAAITAFAEVLWGLRIRQADRVLAANSNDISGPLLHGKTYQEQVNASNRKSLVLVMARPSANKENNSSKWESIESNIDVIASVELRLQPCDAKIPFSLPWWDDIERKVAAFFGIPKDNSAKHLQPYLSTLCVDEKYRGKQIGRTMVRCLEDVAAIKWGYSKIYLHVDGDNKAAMNLYKSEGYKDVGRRWNPFWAGKAAKIGYFVKNLLR